ncbi:MAG: arginine--tRNA ligase [Lachnospiraceae bacterium]|jgi:arginyl-tRNA synthetase|nr:arginine--tRNA ligase [Lachnospiraceae bacterium]
MKTLIEEISNEIKQAFAALGYDPELGKATVSKRPDLCEYQCNGAMAGAKLYGKAPLALAEEVAGRLKGSAVFSQVEVAPPGFLNLSLAPAYIRDYLGRMAAAPRFGVHLPEKPQRIIIDYGGANVAKPLHIGHLRSAIIGESIKRLIRYAGHEAIGDVHLGDWGLQMGLIIVEIGERQPGLPYFDASYSGPYPEAAPFTLAELGEIYPVAAAKAKTDAGYQARAQAVTYELQKGRAGYRALWQHIMRISLADLKKNYHQLNVDFDLWKGESDVEDLIPGMVEQLKKDGFAYLSEGALVVDISEEGDTKELPPCLILKSDGAALYLTTDLATILDRVQSLAPDEIVYLTDKRQAMHFTQLFRCAKKTGIAPPSLSFRFLGFGTMNGTDGKPFKTRDGGVMSLEQLVAEINEAMAGKIRANREIEGGEADKVDFISKAGEVDFGDKIGKVDFIGKTAEVDFASEVLDTARIIGLAALKYGDLSNQAAKDYIFDIDRFTSFEGDTGPYILYTIVRIKSILAKYVASGGVVKACDEGCCAVLTEPVSAEEKALMLAIAGFNAMIEAAFLEIAPHRVAAYVYELANALNTFYHQTRILTEPDEDKKASYIALLILTKEVLETSIDLLGFAAPERM